MPKGIWSNSKGYYFRDNSSGYFSHTIHKGKWINIIFIVSITPKKAILRSRVEANSRIYTVPEQTIDIPPGYPDPYIVLGLYRPGSDEIPNPTSTIDFDYIKISKMSDADFNKLDTLSNKMVCYRYGLYDGKYVKEAKRRGLNCN